MGHMLRHDEQKLQGAVVHQAPAASCCSSWLRWLPLEPAAHEDASCLALPVCDRASAETQIAEHSSSHERAST